MRRRRKSLAAGMADVVPGEEGDESSDTGSSGDGGGDTGDTGGSGDGGGAGDTGTVDVSPTDDGSYDYTGNAASGTTTGIQNLQLEVDILSAVAIDRVAGEIAHRTAIAARRHGISGITVASPQAIGFLRLHAALEAEIASLEAMADQAAALAPPGKVETTDTTAFAPMIAAAPLIAQAVKAAPELVKKAAGVLKIFAATTVYSGRSNPIRSVLLDAALARHLSAHDLAVDLPERSLPAVGSGGLIGRILTLQTRCHQLQDGEGADVDAVLGPVETLVSALFAESDDPGNVPFAQQLMLADAVADGMVKGRALLTSEIAFSGGSYRARRWILNVLFGKDGLTYNGGAGVTFFLFDAETRAALDSDTIYFASPHGQFRDRESSRLEPTNIPRRDRRG